MAITLHHKIVLSNTIPANTLGNVGSFDLTTGGKGGTNLNNVTIIVVAKVVARLSTGPMGHISNFGLFSRFGGVINIFSINPEVEIASDGDSGWSAANPFLRWDSDGANTIIVTFVFTGSGGDTASVSGILDVHVRP